MIRIGRCFYNVESYKQEKDFKRLGAEKSEGKMDLYSKKNNQEERCRSCCGYKIESEQKKHNRYEAKLSLLLDGKQYICMSPPI